MSQKCWVELITIKKRAGVITQTWPLEGYSIVMQLLIKHGVSLKLYSKFNVCPVPKGGESGEGWNACLVIADQSELNRNLFWTPVVKATVKKVRGLMMNCLKISHLFTLKKLFFGVRGYIIWQLRLYSELSPKKEKQ